MQSRNKKGKREYLNDVKTKDFMVQLNDFFESFVEIPRIKVGGRQTIETLINEEALLFAKYLRNEDVLSIHRIIKDLRSLRPSIIEKDLPLGHQLEVYVL